MWFQIMKDFWNGVREEGAETLKILKLWEQYTIWYQNADKARKYIAGSSLTEQLEAADRNRDKIFSGLHSLVKGFVKNSNAQKGEAARKVERIFHAYGNPTNEERQTETSDLYNLIKDLREKVTAEVNLLGLMTEVTELDKANKEYENLDNAKAVEEAGEELPYTFKECRDNLSRIYTDIITRVDVLILDEGIATWEAFVKAWNEKVKEYKRQIELEETLREKKKIDI
jgi:hypothetical protein